MCRPTRLALLALAAGAPFLAVSDRLPAATEARLSLASEWSDVKAEPTKIGEVRRFFKAPTATVGELAVHVTTINAGEASHAPHRHPEEELIIIKEGTVESFQEGTTRRLGPGSVIFQASGELHGLRNVGTGPATYHVVKWTPIPAEKAQP